MATWIQDIVNNCINELGLAPQSVADATVDGTGVDFNNSDMGMWAEVNFGAITGTGVTAAVKLQESETQGGAYTDISGGAFAVKDETGDNTHETINFTRTKRWVRMTITGAGTTPAILVSGSIHGQKKSN